ncbi:MAG: hypothetical protein Q8876_05535 [Bacillota bacterium]|nr:hypothetical protein [Bacillota bacterium]
MELDTIDIKTKKKKVVNSFLILAICISLIYIIAKAIINYNPDTFYLIIYQFKSELLYTISTFIPFLLFILFCPPTYKRENSNINLSNLENEFEIDNSDNVPEQE